MNSFCRLLESNIVWKKFQKWKNTQIDWIKVANLNVAKINKTSLNVDLSNLIHQISRKIPNLIQILCRNETYKWYKKSLFVNYLIIETPVIIWKGHTFYSCLIATFIHESTASGCIDLVSAICLFSFYFAVQTKFSNCIHWSLWGTLRKVLSSYNIVLKVTVILKL